MSAIFQRHDPTLLKRDCQEAFIKEYQNKNESLVNKPVESTSVLPSAHTIFTNYFSPGKVYILRRRTNRMY